jgi:hypothetical protein
VPSEGRIKKAATVNPVPEGMLRDELTAMSPAVLDGELDRLDRHVLTPDDPLLSPGE